MKKKQNKKNQSKLYVVTVFMGIIIMFYPVIAKIVNKKNQTDAIIKYAEQIEEMDEKDVESQKKQYEKYNKQIIEDKISAIDLLESGKILGYVKIEKINVFLPIYEGTDEKTLIKGIGHLEKTTMPTANYAYHSVFVGHTGITSKKFFDDLTRLRVGDEFVVTILDESYTYKVCKIKEVLPSETKDLKVQSNKQLVTLVTCVPKYVNSHRILVTGQRI